MVSPKYHIQVSTKISTAYLGAVAQWGDKGSFYGKALSGIVVLVAYATTGWFQVGLDVLLQSALGY